MRSIGLFSAPVGAFMLISGGIGFSFNSGLTSNLADAMTVLCQNVTSISALDACKKLSGSLSTATWYLDTSYFTLAVGAALFLGGTACFCCCKTPAPEDEQLLSIQNSSNSR